MPAPNDPAVPPAIDRGYAGSAAEESRAPGDARDEPDPRFIFANERTYLAWNRTALALVVAGLAVAQFLKVGLEGAQLIVAIPLIALGAFLAYRSYRQWQNNVRALRLARPLPASSLPEVLVYGIAVFALAALVLAILHFTSS